MNLTIISDDLTGAIDSGSFAFTVGCPVRIETYYENDITKHDGMETIAVNLASRVIPGPDALKRHVKAGEKVKLFPDQVVMKKIDTGYRGNQPFEIEGMLRGLGKDVCFLVDHSPTRNTFTLYGNQYVDGVILEKSVFAKEDPLKRPKSSYVPDILREHTDFKTELVTIDSLKGGTLLEDVSIKIKEGCRILVFDCITKDDCDRIIGTLMPEFPDALWCGSLGLVRGLVEYIYGKNTVDEYTPEPGLRSIAFTASAYSIVQRQIKDAEPFGLKRIPLNMDKIIKGDRTEIDSVVEKCLEINKTDDFIISPELSPENECEEASDVILNSVTECAKKLAEKASYDRIVIVGGETSYSIINAIGASKVILKSKPETGIGVGIVQDGIAKGKEVATKGGSIGTVHAVSKMLGYPANDN